MHVLMCVGCGVCVCGAGAVNPVGRSLVGQVLDLEGNRVREVDQLVHLRSCACLNALTLEANPLAKHPVYRRVVHHYLPTLSSLDDEPFEANDREPVCMCASSSSAAAAVLCPVRAAFCFTVVATWAFAARGAQ